MHSINFISVKCVAKSGDTWPTTNTQFPPVDIRAVSCGRYLK